MFCILDPASTPKWCTQYYYFQKTHAFYGKVHLEKFDLVHPEQCQLMTIIIRKINVIYKNLKINLNDIYFVMVNFNADRKLQAMTVNYQIF